MKLVLKKGRNGYSIRPKNTRLYREKKLILVSEEIAIPAGEIEAGTYEVERVMLPSISGWNRTWQKGLNVSINTPILLSLKKTEPWIMIKGSGIGWPEEKLRFWQNGQANKGLDGTGDELTNWGDFAIEIIEGESPTEEQDNK